MPVVPASEVGADLDPDDAFGCRHRGRNELASLSGPSPPRMNAPEESSYGSLPPCEATCPPFKPLIDTGMCCFGKKRLKGAEGGGHTRSWQWCIYQKKCQVGVLSSDVLSEQRSPLSEVAVISCCIQVPFPEVWF